MGRETSVVVADGQRLLADALTVALSDAAEFVALPWSPATMEEAVEAVEHLRPDVVVLDHWMPGRLDALDATRAIVEASPTTAVVLTSWVHSAEHVDAALAAGAAGFLPKSVSLNVLHDAIARAAAGERPVLGEGLRRLTEALRRQAEAAEREWSAVMALSRREVEVVRGLASGLSVPRLAPLLHVSAGTLRNHIQHILKKTGARNQREVIRMARACGLVPTERVEMSGSAPGAGGGGPARRRGRDGRLSVVVADEQRLFADALARALGHYGDLDVVATHADGHEAMAMTVALSPDVVVYDYWMPGTSGAAATRYLASWSPSTAVVLSSWLHGPTEVEHTTAAGALGLVSKRLTIDQLVESVRAAAAGAPLIHAERTTKRRVQVSASTSKPWVALATLTPREVEVLRLLARGHTMKEIAARLGIALGTTRNHARNILKKTGTSTSAEAVRMAHDEGLVHEVGLPGGGEAASTPGCDSV